MNEFKIGDKVTITTTAGARSVDKNGVLCGTGGYRHTAIIAALGYVLPTYPAQNRPSNNAVVRICETGQIVFIHTDCLATLGKEIKVRYFCDGEDVTDSVSDETKRNLRR